MLRKKEIDDILMKLINEANSSQADEESSDNESSSESEKGGESDSSSSFEEKVNFPFHLPIC